MQIEMLSVKLRVVLTQSSKDSFIYDLGNGEITTHMGN